MEFNVPDMSCGHCTAAIENSVTAADPSAAVHCDLPARRVRIESTRTAEELSGVLRAAGYEATPV